MKNRSVSVFADQRSMHRAITSSVLATMQRGEPSRVLRAAWPGDERASMLLKGASSPTSTANFPAIDVYAVFRSLAPGSAALALFDQCTKLDMKGVHTWRIPRVAALPPQPVFVAEGAPAPAVQWATASTVLGPAKKILVISAVTRELNEATPETASAVIGRVIADSANKSIDLTAFGTGAGDTATPPGLLNGVTPITAAAASGQATLGEMIAEDLAALAGAIGNAGIDPSDTVYIASPREAALIDILVKNDVLMTLGLPAKTVLAVAPAGVFSGYQDVPTIQTSNEVAIHFEDTTPKEIVSSPGVIAAPTRSAFQTEVTAIRVRAWAAWAAAPGAVQVINNVNW